MKIVILSNGEEYRQPETYEEMMSPENIKYHKELYTKWLNENKDKPCECGHGTIGECAIDCHY